MLNKAVEALSDYIGSFRIDLFAFPIYTAGLNVVLIDAKDLLRIVQEYADEGRVFPMFEMRTNEAYFRLRTRYAATINLPLLKGAHVEVIKPRTFFKRLEDVPHVRNILARDFEVFVADTVNGTHYGDDLCAIDVIDQFGRRIECKKGKGMLIKQVTPTR